MNFNALTRGNLSRDCALSKLPPSPLVEISRLGPDLRSNQDTRQHRFAIQVPEVKGAADTREYPPPPQQAAANSLDSR